MVDFLNVIHIVQDGVHQFLTTMDIERLYHALNNDLPTTPTYRRRVLNLLSRVKLGITYHQKRWNLIPNLDRLSKLGDTIKRAEAQKTGAIGIFEWFREEF